MVRFLRYHAVQSIVGALLVLAALGAYRRWLFVDNVGVVTAGSVYRSGQPNDRQWGFLRRRDVSLVLNLRTLREDADIFGLEQQICHDAGATMRNVPIETRLPSDAQLESALRELRTWRPTALIHCQHGEDRSGIIIAAYRVVLQNWPVHKALTEMRRYRADSDPERLADVRAMLLRLSGAQRDWLRRTHPNSGWVLAPGIETRSPAKT